MRVWNDDHERLGYWTKVGLGQQRALLRCGTRLTVAWPSRPDDCNFVDLTNQQKAEILVFGVAWGLRAQITGPTHIFLPRRLLILLTNADIVPPSLRKKGVFFNDLHKTEGQTVWSLLLPFQRAPLHVSDFETVNLISTDVVIISSLRRCQSSYLVCTSWRNQQMLLCI